MNVEIVGIHKKNQRLGTKISTMKPVSPSPVPQRVQPPVTVQQPAPTSTTPTVISLKTRTVATPRAAAAVKQQYHHHQQHPLVMQQQPQKILQKSPATSTTSSLESAPAASYVCCVFFVYKKIPNNIFIHTGF